MVVNDNDIDIIERLLGFESHGITSSDRFHLRNDAAGEISRLRAQLDIARTALLKVERLSEEGRAALSKIQSTLKG